MNKHNILVIPDAKMNISNNVSDFGDLEEENEDNPDWYYKLAHISAIPTKLQVVAQTIILEHPSGRADSMLLDLFFLPLSVPACVGIYIVFKISPTVLYLEFSYQIYIGC